MSRELYEAAPAVSDVDLRVRRLEARVVRLEEQVRRLSSAQEPMAAGAGAAQRDGAPRTD
jgi:hypothetical protein